MAFDFDHAIDRKGTGSLKWELYGERDIIPMWVADMDFAAPPAVLNRLHQRLDHGVLGYAVPPQSTVDAVVNALARMHNWSIRGEWLVWLPGLVPALHVISDAFSAPGEEVATFTPIYPPFLSSPPFANRSVVTAPMVLRNGRYEMDLDGFEAALSEKTTLLLFCNPQNPTGRAFDRNELLAIHEICRSHGVFVCSDEIHCDLILDPEKQHIPFCALTEEAASNSLVLMAPSKTYNVAGLNCSFAVVPDDAVRDKLRRAMGESLPHVNALGYEACAAAYDEGEPWRRQLIEYLRENRNRVERAVASMPGVSYVPGEATFLAWLDCRGLGVERPRRLFEKAGVGLSDGFFFGAPGFLRLNFGCPRAMLEEGLSRMIRALNQGQPHKNTGE